jgi:hypothetical protein
VPSALEITGNGSIYTSVWMGFWLVRRSSLWTRRRRPLPWSDSLRTTSGLPQP